MGFQGEDLYVVVGELGVVDVAIVDAVVVAVLCG